MYRSNSTYIQKTWRDKRGFTFIEVFIVLSIAGILVAVAIPNFIKYRGKAILVETISELKLIERDVSLYDIENNGLPNTLADVGWDTRRDASGNPYQYLRIDGGTTPGIDGRRRKDKNANPANSDFDLYSMGKDGRTVPQFSENNARDDIVRANDGVYFGLAEKH